VGRACQYARELETAACATRRKNRCWRARTPSPNALSAQAAARVFAIPTTLKRSPRTAGICTSIRCAVSRCWTVYRDDWGVPGNPTPLPTAHGVWRTRRQGGFPPSDTFILYVEVDDTHFDPEPQQRNVPNGTGFDRVKPDAAASRRHGVNSIFSAPVHPGLIRGPKQSSTAADGRDRAVEEPRIQAFLAPDGGRANRVEARIPPELCRARGSGSRRRTAAGGREGWR